MSHSAKSVENIDAQQSALFNMICDDLESKSYSVQQNALPAALIKLLCERVKSEDEPHYRSAGIGRSTAHHENRAPGETKSHGSMMNCPLIKVGTVRRQGKLCF